MRLGIRHVRVLVRLEAARDLFREAVGDGVVRLGRVVLDRGGADDDLRAVGPQHRDLLLAHLVRHDEDAAVALLRRRDREADAGVARGRLDDGAAGLELSFGLGLLDHGQTDPVLHRSTGVEVLELGEDLRLGVPPDRVEPDDRRVADEVENGGVIASHRREAYFGGAGAAFGR